MAKIDEKFMKGNRELARQIGLKIKPDKSKKSTSTKKKSTGKKK